MFVGIQVRHRRTLVWATPLLFAALWLAYVLAATLAPEQRRAPVEAVAER